MLTFIKMQFQATFLESNCKILKNVYTIESQFGESSHNNLKDEGVYKILQISNVIYGSKIRTKLMCFIMFLVKEIISQGIPIV